MVMALAYPTFAAFTATVEVGHRSFVATGQQNIRRSDLDKVREFMVFSCLVLKKGKGISDSAFTSLQSR
jgi:hypothetical protein